MMRVVSVISGNGGGGKSFFSCNLAYGLATLGKRVLLVEAGLGKRADDVICGIMPDTLYCFKDVLDGTCRPEEAISLSGDNTFPDFIPASHNFCSCDPADGFDKIRSYAEGKYDYVVIDTTPCTEALSIADTAIAICDTSYISIRNTGICVKRALDAGADLAYTLVNHTTLRSQRADICLEDIIDETGAPLIGIIPYDEFVPELMENGDLIFKYNTASGRALENICRRIMGESVPEYEKGERTGIFSRNKLVLKYK